MASPYYDMIEEVRVILVNHDKEFVTEMVDLLKSYQYKVTMVDMASTAMMMLSKGKEKFDVMIINVHSPDLLSFQLFAQAVALDIISLFICDEDNELLAKKALHNGAYLYLKKPLNEEIVKYLWQFVFTEKLKKARKEKGNQINIVGDDEQARETNNVPNTEDQSNNTHDIENDIVSNKKYNLRRKRGKKSKKVINEGESQSNAINKIVRQKVCTEWTLDLHTKFMEAVQQIGEGRCYPKEILKVMNVPGLTRMQVASHLQKCRSNNWRAPEKQKYIRHSSGERSSNDTQQRRSIKKFGIMPRLQTNVPNLQHDPNQTQRGPQFSFQQFNPNNNFTRGESSTQQELYYLQLQNHGPSSGGLPNEYSEFDKVYSDDQVAPISSVQFQEITNSYDETST